MIMAAQAGDVEAVRRCLDSGTDVNSTSVIIFHMTIDVFAWWLYGDHILQCNDDIYYRWWIIVLFWISLWWHHRRYKPYYMNCNILLTHINDHCWRCEEADRFIHSSTWYQWGVTALRKAAKHGQHGHTEVAMLLISRGADVNSKNKVSDTIKVIVSIVCVSACVIVIMICDGSVIVMRTIYCQHTHHDRYKCDYSI